MRIRIRINYKKLFKNLLIAIGVAAVIAAIVITIVTIVNSNSNKKKMESYGFDTLYETEGKHVTYNEVKKLVLSAALNTRDEMYYTSFGIDEKDVIVGWSVLSSALGIPNSDVDARENVSENVAADYIVNVVEMILKQDVPGDTLKDKALSLDLDYTDKLLKKSKLNAWIVQIFEDYSSLNVNNGMKITNSNKPSNYKIYPYIVDGIPKKIYTLKMDEAQVLPKDAYIKCSSYFNNIKETVENYFELILNVDYATLNEEAFLYDLNRYLAYGTHTLVGEERIVSKDIENYLKHVKDNNIKTKGNVTTLFPIFYGKNGKYFLRVKCEFEIIEANSRKDILLYDKKVEYTNSKYMVYTDIPVISVSASGIFKVNNGFSIWNNLVFEER